MIKMKKIYIMILLFILSIAYFGSRASNTLTNFSRFYNLSEDSALVSLSVFSYDELNATSESTVSLNLLTEDGIDFEKKKLFYEKFSKIEFFKAKPEPSVHTDSGPEYDMSIGLESSDEFRSFDISIGKFYLLITPMNDGGEYIYKHELTEEEYSILKGYVDILIE